MTSDYVLLAGTANVPLARDIATRLEKSLAACRIDRFPDGEVAVELGESVRGRDVFLLQPTCVPVNDHLMELLALTDACRRAAAAHITAIVPYFGYARADKRAGRRTPVTARTVADMMQSAGIDHVVTLDAHTPQLEGFFHVPIDDLSATALLADVLRPLINAESTIVSPDLGGARRAAKFSERLARPTAICVKRRMDGENVTVTQLIGDVRGRSCIIVDDMITTGSTTAEAAGALRAAGVREPLIAVATHAILVPGARERLGSAGISQLLVTDSIPVEEGGAPPLRCASIAPLLADVIRRLSGGESLRPLY